MHGLDLRALRYFVRVAETESIAPAAMLLNIAERELLESHERLARDLRRRSGGEGGLVVLGHRPGSLYNGVLPGAIRRLRRAHPAIQVSAEVMPAHEQLQALRNGRLGLCVQGSSAPERGLEHRVFARERDDPAAMERLVEPERGSPSLRTKFLAACEAIGFEPNIAHVTGDMVSALALVASGLGVCVAWEGLARLADSRIHVRPLPLLEMRTDFSIVWRPDALAASAAHLLDALAQETLGHAGAEPPGRGDRTG